MLRILPPARRKLKPFYGGTGDNLAPETIPPLTAAAKLL
jgi:hypothetical protein